MEAYVLLGFFAFLTGLAHVRGAPGTFPESLLQSKWTKRRTIRWGTPFKTGQGAQNFFFYSIVQFMIVKPVILLAIAIYYQKNGEDVPRNLRILLNLVSSLSIVIATLAVLRIYKGLISVPNSVLTGHRAILKIGVVKLLFIFIVLNSAVLKNLANNDSLPIPPRLCTEAVVAASDKNREFCEVRTINVIMILEILICMVPAILSYRHHGLGLSAKWHLKYPIGKFILLIFLRPFDLPMFWNGRLPRAVLSEEPGPETGVTSAKGFETQLTSSNSV